MDDPSPVDRLAPESRFALRAVAAGLAMDEAATVLRLDAATLRKHLRTAVRDTGGAAPPPSEGDAALLAALAPAIAAAREPPHRAPSKPCPEADVAEALAFARLDGPLMLAEAEHAADCPACLARLVALRRAGPVAASDPVARSVWPVVIGVAVGLAAAVWWLHA